MKVVTLDKKVFEKAFNLCQKEHTNQEIFDCLEGTDDVEKQIAILQLKNLENTNQANALVKHMTGFDGPIREAASIKVHEFFTLQKTNLLDNLDYYQTYVDAVCDVNPNICRLVIDFLPKLANRKELYNLILNKINLNFNRIDNPDVEQKNFLTVRLFNLYWCLEAVGAVLHADFEPDCLAQLLPILKRAISFDDYTINEKVAKIVTYSDLTKKVFDEIVPVLAANSNFYVRRYFGQKR